MNSQVVILCCVAWIALDPVVHAAHDVSQFLDNYCAECHSGSSPAANVVLEGDTFVELAENIGGLERAVRKLRSHQMPPADSVQPEQDERAAVLNALIEKLDQQFDLNPNPGRIDSMRRLTRTEYQNAIRDLLSLEIDATALLPNDESSHGFDNITVSNLSPTLMNRYVSAAQKISRLAVGTTGRGPGGETFRIKPDVTQEDRVDGLPLGTRGGALIHYHFPQSGRYQIDIRLARDRNEHVEGLTRTHQLEVLLDREHVKSFKVSRPPDADHSIVDAHLKLPIDVTAGPHTLGITFVQDGASLLETMRQPLESKFNTHRHPRQAPAIYEVSIVGPFSHSSAASQTGLTLPGLSLPGLNLQGDALTPSQKQIFVALPNTASEEDECAERIVRSLTRRAYRRPTTAADLINPLRFYRESREAGEDFQAAIESALSAILVSPNFLFRIELQPENLSRGENYAISDWELASRLSFFIWSSIPDEELMAVAESGKLRDPGVLEAQVLRMLADPRSMNLVENFAAQWLYLRNLDAITPDARLFPDFDDNLRQAMRKETELLLAEIVREDKSVLALLESDHTYLNQRLAKHYGVPQVYGTHFRKVDLPPDSVRGGMLRHASILTVTSYATRTSPVIRGNWILKNLLGSPPPPPPANVPALEDNTVASDLPIRERLAAHRDNAACAGCHNLMDPIGFALENFDAVGRWREVELGEPIDASGALPGSEGFVGVEGLEEALLNQSDLFVAALAEKLLTFAIGRGVEAFDGPTIRKIVQDAEEDDLRFSAIVLGVVESAPFQMRKAE